MKPGEKDVYICLMHRSERYCSRELTITDAEIEEEVGAASRTSCDARKRLQEYGLIRCKKTAGNKYRYVICDPLTCAPYPGDPTDPITCKKSPTKSTASSNDASSALAATSRQEEQKSLLNSHGLPGVFDQD
jgi:hypothetical protein